MGAKTKKVLVSGASFAGLSTAFWMRGLGYEVTVVEVARELRRGGTAVDIKGNTVDIVRRMGLLEAIRANRLSLKRWEFKNARDETERSMVLRGDGEPPREDEFEIERDVLLTMLFERVCGDVDVVFDESVTALHDSGEAVEATFAKGAARHFDLVLGCDGVHSAVRRLTFGAEATYAYFLGQYFSVSIVEKLLIERDTAQMFNVPGKAVMLNAYKDKTDIILAFASDEELAYDRRDPDQQRRIVAERFAGEGWRTAELLEEVRCADNFYFDKLCQIRMPAWSKGRIALVGDAAYCASPAAGMGGSLAIDGAAAFADAMRACDGDHARAFHDYEERFRPFVEGVQADAVRVGLETLVARTEEAIRARNTQTDLSF